MWKFIRGKGQQPAADRQKLQKELFAYKKVSITSSSFPRKFPNLSRRSLRLSISNNSFIAVLDIKQQRSSVTPFECLTRVENAQRRLRNCSTPIVQHIIVTKVTPCRASETFVQRKNKQIVDERYFGCWQIRYESVVISYNHVAMSFESIFNDEIEIFSFQRLVHLYLCYKMCKHRFFHHVDQHSCSFCLDFAAKKLLKISSSTLCVTQS